MPDLVTFTQVPIARVGDWPAASGSGLIEAADLQSMVDASNDPEIQAVGAVRGWLGHNGMYDDWGDPIGRDPFDSSEAAIGTIENLAVTDDGQTLLADLVDVPDVVAVLFPQRSIETVGGVVTSSGTRYACVLTGMAYLGRSDPAVSGLPDLLQASASSDGSALSAAGLRFDGEPALMAALPADIPSAADDATLARVTRRALATQARTDLSHTSAGPPATDPQDNSMPSPTPTPVTTDSEARMAAQRAYDEVIANGQHSGSAFSSPHSRLAGDRLAAHANARTRLLDDAIAVGKFPKTRRRHYADLYDRDPAGTTQLIGQLAALGSPLDQPVKRSAHTAGTAGMPDEFPADQPLPVGLSLLGTRSDIKKNREAYAAARLRNKHTVSADVSLLSRRERDALAREREAASR